MKETDENVDTLFRWCSTVVDYFAKIGNDPTVQEFKGVVEQAGKKKSLRDLRSLKRDLAEWARALSPSQRQGLEDALRAVTSPSLASEDAKDRDAVKRILERDTLANEDEYRLLSAWIDAIQDEPAHEEEVKKIDALLARFGTRQG